MSASHEPQDTAGIEISRRLVLVNAASSVLRKGLLLAVLVWLQQHLVRRIEPEEYSLYPVLMALMLAFPLLTSLFMSGLRRYVTAAYARADLLGVTRLVSSMAPPLAGLSVVLLTVGAFCVWNIADILTIAPALEGDARIMFGLLIFGATLRLALAPFGLGFYLRQRFVLLNVLGLSVELVRITVLISLLSDSTRVLWVVVAMFVAGLYEVIVTTIVSRRLVPALTFRRALSSRAAIRPIFTFGGWAFLNHLGLLMRDAADPVILNKLANPIDVQTFYLGSLPDTQCRLFTLEALTTTQPALTAMYASGQHDRLARTFLRLCRYSLWVMAFLALPLSLYSDELFRLYLREHYAENAAGATVLALLMARYAVIFPSMIVGMVAVARAEVRATSVRSVILSSINLALTLYLVGALGMGPIGSALATFLVGVVGAPLIMWPLGLRLSGNKFGPWVRHSILPGFVPALVAAPAWLAARALLPPDTWLLMGIDVALGALVYVAALLLFALQPQDRAELAQLLAKWRARFFR